MPRCRIVFEVTNIARGGIVFNAYHKMNMLGTEYEKGHISTGAYILSGKPIAVADATDWSTLTGRDVISALNKGTAMPIATVEEIAAEDLEQEAWDQVMEEEQQLEQERQDERYSQEYADPDEVVSVNDGCSVEGKVETLAPEPVLQPKPLAFIKVVTS